MALVSADSLQLSAVLEASPGVTPATPAFDLFRITGEGLTFAPTVSESGELGGSGRFARPGNVTGMTVSGDISFELSDYPALTKAIAGVLAANWGECPLTGAVGGAIDGPERITVGNQLKTFTVEKRFPNPASITGAMPVAASVTTPAPAAAVQFTFAGGPAVGTGVAVIQLAVDDGPVATFRVPIAVGESDTDVVTSALPIINADTRFAATDGGSGALDVALSTGTSITTADARAGSDGFFYQRYRGVSYTSLSLSASPNNPVTGTLSTAGGVPELDVLPIPGATYVTAGTGAVYTAPEVLDLSVGSVLGIGTHCWTDLSITIESNNRGVPCIGTQGDREVVLGTLSATLSGEVYFSDQALLDALLANQTVGDGTVAFSNSDGDILRFDFYGNKPISGELTAGGQGEDLTIPVELQPTPVTVCDDGAGNDWTSGLIISTVNTAPTLP